MNSLQDNRFLAVHIVVLRGAVRSEKRGMRRSGKKKAARLIAIEEFKLPPKSTHDEVIAALTAKLEELA